MTCSNYQNSTYAVAPIFTLACMCSAMHTYTEPAVYLGPHFHFQMGAMSSQVPHRTAPSCRFSNNRCLLWCVALLSSLVKENCCLLMVLY